MEGQRRAPSTQEPFRRPTRSAMPSRTPPATRWMRTLCSASARCRCSRASASGRERMRMQPPHRHGLAHAALRVTKERKSRNPQNVFIVTYSTAYRCRIPAASRSDAASARDPPGQAAPGLFCFSRIGNTLPALPGGASERTLSFSCGFFADFP